MNAAKVDIPAHGCTTSTLTALPFEILRRIVELGSIYNALRLKGVCRLFRDLCTDSLIYSAIIENGNGFDGYNQGTAYPQKEHPANGSPLLRPHELTALAIAREDHSLSYAGLFDTTWWERVSSLPGFEIESALRWALADFKARQLLCDAEEEPKKDESIPSIEVSRSDDEEPSDPDPFLERMPDSLTWFPELLLTGHPATAVFCDQSRACAGEDFVRLFQEAEGSKDLEKQWGACLVRACYGVPSQMLPQTKKCVEYGSCRMILTSATGHQQLISAEPADNSIFYAALYENSWAHHAHAVLAVGVLRRRTFDIALARRVTERSKLPPVLYHIPKYTKLSMTPPFSSAGTTTISTAHLETMLSPSFLEDGEWRGYYDYSFASRRSRDRFDEIMTGIKFRIVTSATEEGKLEMEARNCSDQHGRFRVVGTADRKTGSLSLQKQYEQGRVWDWTAVMTPFGIVGCWGDHVWGGWFWLWKKAWVERLDGV